MKIMIYSGLANSFAYVHFSRHHWVLYYETKLTGALQTDTMPSFPEELINCDNLVRVLANTPSYYEELDFLKSLLSQTLQRMSVQTNNYNSL